MKRLLTWLPMVMPIQMAINHTLLQHHTSIINGV